jgi:transcriptional regulator with XRE-family HTH domain
METKQASRHVGRKIGRIRELLGVKQETLADKLGITQQAVSKLEQSEELEAPTLDRVAKALGVSVEMIKSFSEEAVFNILANTITNNDYGSVISYCPSFNPVDKWLEALEENKRLYEALLKSEREKIAMLEKMLNKS